MTARQLYESILIELNKENAPNIMLEEFNYFANKSINQYVNKRYNIYDINQQTTDDLRVLKATAFLDVTKINDYDGLSLASNATYETILPSDYLHLLNCICIYDVNKTFKCYNRGDTWRCAATRLTSDAYSQVLDNFWNKPSYKKPYYYIHNINTNNINPTNPYNNGTGTDFDNFSTPNYEIYTDEEIKGIVDHYDNSLEDGNYLSYYDEPDSQYRSPAILHVLHQSDPEASTDSYGIPYENTIYPIKDTDLKYIIKDDKWILLNEKDRSGNDIINSNDKQMFSSINIKDSRKISNIERAAQVRYGNASRVRLEIRYGTDDSVFKLKKVYIDYIKAPQNIRLTQEQLDYTEDTSQVLEFPDYVCQEIINELVHIIMENISDPKLQTHPVVSQSIANPTQTQTPEAAGQSA